MVAREEKDKREMWKLNGNKKVTKRSQEGESKPLALIRIMAGAY